MPTQDTLGLVNQGRPGITERVYVQPPGSQIGPITAPQRQSLLQDSLVAGLGHARKQELDRCPQATEESEARGRIATFARVRSASTSTVRETGCVALALAVIGGFI